MVAYSFDDLTKRLSPLLRDLARVQREARRLGLFVEARDPQECPECGLMEDVLASGILLTCYRADWEAAWNAGCRDQETGAYCEDTGLRFKAINQHAWRCPSCQTAVALPPEVEFD